MSETYDNKAVNGKELAEQTLVGVASEIKREGYVSAAAFNEVVARLIALEKAVAESNIGDRIADSIDAQTLKAGGVEVKTRQTAKSNPDASSGSANTFVDTLKQNENGELTATRRVMKMYSGTGTNTDAPMTQKAASDAIALKADIASPTFTGTPKAPTVTASTDNTQIASTAFVHDAIENDLKKAADVAGMGNDDTHAYSGKAVSMAISSAVSGEVGGYLGNMTVAQMNAYTNPKMGDNAIVTNTGTITVGSTSCVISEAPSEVRWTTSGSWQVTSAGYVRDTQAYNSTPEYVGTVGSAGNSTNWSRGNHVHPISLSAGDNPGTVKIAGQNVRVNGLEWCESEGRFVIDIHGSATSLKADTPIYYESTAMYIPVQTTVPAGYSSWSDVFSEAVTRWGRKGRIYAIVGGTAPGVSTVKYEKYIPASYIFVPSSETDPDYIMFTEVSDDLYDSPSNENRGLIRTYTLNRNGWSSTPSSFWPSYAERALNDGYGNSLVLGISNNVVSTIGGKNLYAATAGSAASAGSATNATNATNDGNGDNIVNTYARKQAFVNLGSISSASIPTSSSTSWSAIFIHTDPVIYSPGKPHIYTACLNIVGYTQQYGNFATAQIALTRGGNSPDAAPSETLLMFAPVIQSGMGSVPVTISAPFTLGESIYADFRPRLWIKLDQVSAPFSVNGNHYFHSIST
jgi:hypothetical protein